MFNFDQLWNQFANWIYENLTIVLKMMYGLIIKFPKISEMGELFDLYEFVTVVSLVCMSITIIYLGAKMFTTSASTSSKIKLKSIIGRLMYALCFIATSGIIMDLLIDFNNVLVDVFCTKFDLVNMLSQEVYVTNWIELLAIGIAIFQLFIAAKVMIGYFLRVAEVALMYVTNPIMICLWINPSWGSHFSSWLNRLVSLIFTQFSQIIILIIYSKVIFAFSMDYSVYKLCLGAAFLILMEEMPSWISKYISPDNSATIMAKTGKKIGASTKRIFRSKKSNSEG